MTNNKSFITQRIFLLLLTVVTCLPCAHAEKVKSTPVALPTSLREYTKQTAGRQAYGLYFQNRKSGWMIYESKIENRGSGSARKEVAVSRMEMLISMERGAT